MRTGPGPRRRSTSTPPAVAAVAVALAALAGFTLPGAAAAQPAPLEGLASYIESSMADWEIPGLAIAVVKDGETVWAEGFGVRDVRTGEPVDASTIFAIGSASKAFTSASVAMLVQEGLVDWDDRATAHLPSFETSDPFVTRELTVRDLLSHRSGLNRGDQVWYATGFERGEILDRVRRQPPTSSFRSEFGYNNNMFLAAGQIVPAVTGLSWDDFVDRRIFAPLDMERSTTSTLQLEGMENVAQPHQEIDGRVVAIPWRNIDNIAPAGSINSSVSEMTAWLKLHLAGGEFQGRRVLDEEVIHETHSPHTLIRREGPWKMMSPEANFFMYGMGWFMNDYRGRKVVQHGGNIDGMHALVGMMPDEELGLVVLTNLNPNGLTYALMYRVFDAYLGGEPRDWSGRVMEEYSAMMEAAEAQQEAMEEARAEGTTPSLEPTGYTGTYRHPMYGDLEVTVEDGGLVARRGTGFVGDLEHWHYDTFRIEWREESMGEAFVTFELDAAGEVARAEVQGLGEMERVGPGAGG